MIAFIKLLDKVFGSFLLLFFGFFSSSKAISKHPKKIALIQLWGIGETILCLPAVEKLRKNNKNAVIDVITTSRAVDVFAGQKYISNVRLVSLNPLLLKWFLLRNFRSYDLVIDMEEYLNISSVMAYCLGKERIGYSHGIRSSVYNATVKYNDKQHVVYTFLDLLRPLGIVRSTVQLIPLFTSKKDIVEAEKTIKKYNIKGKLVGFGVGAAESAKTRMWPPERFAKLADHLISKKKVTILFFGSPDEKEYIEKLIKKIGSNGKNSIKTNNKKINVINLAGKTNVPQMFYLIKKCSLFIGNDSGPMHAAAAQGVKTIGLFGCNLPVRFAPFGKGNVALDKKKNKEACINVHLGQVRECCFGIENACVKKISVKDVIRSI